MANNTSTQAPTTLCERFKEVWRGGMQLWWGVGDEIARYQLNLEQAGAELTAARQAKGQEADESFRPIHVISHDRWTGFHCGLPEVPLCKDKTNILGNALQLALMTSEEIAQNFEGMMEPDPKDPTQWVPKTLPFDPADDIIFLFKSVDEEIKTNPLTLTLIRSLMQANMCSPLYVQDKNRQHAREGTRGTRMLVFVTATAEMPNTIPELKPEIIPLPDLESHLNSISIVLESSFQKFESSQGKAGGRRPSDEVLEKIAAAGAGMTCQDFENALSLAWARLQNMDDPSAFIDVIEHEKARCIAKIPGLAYIPRDQITAHPMPGYEDLEAFVTSRMKISRKLAKKHNVNRLKGLAVGGGPGTGKTEIAKRIALLADTIGLIWSLGESKGGHVGDSERTTRQVIQIADAMGAVVLCDDIDKGGIASAGKGYSGDGGTSDNMVQMLLTQTSNPHSKAIYVFTFNRVQNVPPELIRPGRVNGRFYAQRPNGTTRRLIIEEHVRRCHMTIDDPSVLDLLANDLTKDWTGAELAHVLVQEVVIQAIGQGKEVVSAAEMCRLAKRFKPQATLKAFAEDIKEMEELCSQFTPVGCVPEGAAAAKAPSKARSSRNVTSN